MLLIQEYINPFLILSNVIKKSNRITSNAITEGIINITPSPPHQGAPILCNPIIKPNDDKIRPIILHIIDITFDILNCFICFPPLLLD